MAKKPAAAHVIHDSCRNCRYWVRLEDAAQVPAADVLGECRRYPPTVFDLEDLTDEPIQALPEVMARFYCGEHQRSIT